MKHRRRSDGGTAIESGSKLIVLDKRIGRAGAYRIFKIDLNRHFSTSNPAGRSSAGRKSRRPSDFSLSSCNSSRTNRLPHVSSRKIRTRTNRLLTLGRFGRHLRLSERQQPMFPKPLDCRDQLPVHAGMSVVVLDSKIYLIGGEIWIVPNTPRLSRDVYSIDPSADSPEIVRMSCDLNYKRSEPIVCTIGGKIYVMPNYFTHPHHRYFECFDPKSNSSTVLRSPPIPPRDEYKKYEPGATRFLRVMSHAVVGSNLVISLRSAGVFTFDTTQPDRGWRRIHLILDSDSDTLLDFLPLDARFSFPIRDNLIFCSPRKYRFDNDCMDGELISLLRAQLNIEDADSYVCSFDDATALSNPECEFVKVSICPVTGMESKWKIRTMDKELEAGIFVKSSRTIGDDMVLVAKQGDYYYSFDIFHLRRAEDNRYEASNISSALFRSRFPILGYIDLDSSFVIKDGNLTP